MERGTGTLLAVEPDATVYVKLRTVDGPLPVAGSNEYGLGYFLLAVEEVLEDAPADWEGAMRITSRGPVHARADARRALGTRHARRARGAPRPRA